MPHPSRSPEEFILSEVEGRRELISVPPRVEALVRAFAREHPESTRGVEEILRFRLLVKEEIERLVRS